MNEICVSLYSLGSRRLHKIVLFRHPNPKFCISFAQYKMTVHIPIRCLTGRNVITNNASVHSLGIFLYCPLNSRTLGPSYEIVTQTRITGAYWSGLGLWLCNRRQRGVPEKVIFRSSLFARELFVHQLDGSVTRGLYVDQRSWWNVCFFTLWVLTILVGWRRLPSDLEATSS